MHIEIPAVGSRFSREASPALSGRSEARSHLSSAVEVLLDAVGHDSNDGDRSGTVGLLNGEPSARTSRSRFRDVLGIGVVLIAFFVGVYFLFWMRRVLVPLTFALFLAFLCEPLLAFMVTAPRSAARRLQRCKQGRSRDRKPHDHKGVPVGRAEEDATSSDLDSIGSAASITVSDCDGQAAKTCCASCGKWLQQIWSIFAVLILVVTLLTVTFLIFYGVVRVFADFDWSQFSDSAKMHDIQFLLEKAGIVDGKMNVNFQKVAAEFKSYLLDTASTFFHFVEGFMLCVLMFIFCLIGMLPEINSGRRPSPVKDLVQRYLMVKCVSSLVIAVLVMFALWAMKVPLLVVWGLVTFVTNFIPNLGALIAILAPIPFVWLKPDGTLLDTFVVILVQFLVHNIAGNIIEPHIMSQGLELHPLTIVVALMFWSSIWGIAGAVLSVPISCVLRLWLGELEDHRAKRLYRLFDDPLG
ncbi:tqsA [Symbiodinium natans]|uniref:TqsA protein n=1 Tax=Symbiodinium natans TaxID=878477 RepID=A0A812QRS1_9DINO|nr:tqsA [Symbiodinium natans]